MLLGKRPRPPMKRTTSMTEFAPDLEVSDEPPVPPKQNIPATIHVSPHQLLQHPGAKHPWGPGDFPAEFRRSNNNRALATAAMIPARGPRRNSSNFAETETVETAPFLRSCGLCKRRLSLGRDIFMYRGEIAFCSLECRQLLMNQEMNGKCSLSSMKKDSAPATTATSEPSGAGETVTAA